MKTTYDGWLYAKDHYHKHTWLYIRIRTTLAIYKMYEDDPEFVQHWFDKSYGLHYDWYEVMRYIDVR